MDYVRTCTSYCYTTHMPRPPLSGGSSLVVGSGAAGGSPPPTVVLAGRILTKLSGNIPRTPPSIPSHHPSSICEEGRGGEGRGGEGRGGEGGGGGGGEGRGGRIGEGCLFFRYFEDGNKISHSTEYNYKTIQRSEVTCFTSCTTCPTCSESSSS